MVSGFAQFLVFADLGMIAIATASIQDSTLKKIVEERIIKVQIQFYIFAEIPCE